MVELARTARAGEPGVDALDMVVRSPSSVTETGFATVAEMMRADAATPPNCTPPELTVARLPVPFVLASTRIAPVPDSEAEELTIVSIAAPLVTSAHAKTPVRPTTDRPMRATFVFAVFCADELTVMLDALLKSPSTVARVKPDT